ncbi:hypothetical protein PVAP13_5KG645207 [Panicum virgatum]|uniref:Uncharacterized protein n=1 Tax=Panicum virgatum TaxID=38727 RepID=A0A8T0SV69_PANVG|nr:hypothetical protein PVAP13_5KG645207 [Panicum virgatum]
MALTSLAHWLCTLIEICFGLVGKKAAEKGHVIPKDHLDSKEKELIKIATKGVVRLFIFPMNFPAADDSVVRLFNAVTKAQKPRKDLNPSRTKDAKAADTAEARRCSGSRADDDGGLLQGSRPRRPRRRGVRSERLLGVPIDDRTHYVAGFRPDLHGVGNGCGGGNGERL